MARPCFICHVLGRFKIFDRIVSTHLTKKGRQMDYKALEATITEKVKAGIHDALTDLEGHESGIDTVIAAGFDSAGFPAEIGTAAGSLINMLIAFGANHTVNAKPITAPATTMSITPAVAVAPATAPTREGEAPYSV
jgi:hypothetical protein